MGIDHRNAYIHSTTVMYDTLFTALVKSPLSYIKVCHFNQSQFLGIVAYSCHRSPVDSKLELKVMKNFIHVYHTLRFTFIQQRVSIRRVSM